MLSGAFDGTRNILLSVKVTVGKGGLEYTLGYVRYVKSSKEKSFPWLYVYIIAAIGAVFIIVILILGILYRRRQMKEKKYQKVNQTRLENLESMYARECKEGMKQSGLIIVVIEIDIKALLCAYWGPSLLLLFMDAIHRDGSTQATVYVSGTSR